jgi:hypothetical protein
MSIVNPGLLIQELCSISNKISDADLNRKSELLNSLMIQKEFTSKDIINYHDTLLFLLAYPQNKNIYQLTQNAFSVFENQLFLHLKKYKSKAINELLGSGLSGTYLTSSFGFDLTKHLVQQYKNQISIDTIDWECENGIEILKLILPKCEQDILLLKEESITQWFIELAGEGQNVIEFLLRSLEEKFPEPDVCEYFFLKLKVYVKIDFTGKLPSRSAITHTFNPVFYHDKELVRKINLFDELKIKVKGPLPLNAQAKEQSWRTSQLMLLSLGRETDPLAYGRAEDVEVYDAGRGLSICLNGMRPGKRLPFESYIGYMAYKNGRPIAYGGAWIFGNRARIGLNVFEPYRGGESTWIFAAILRTYSLVFNIQHLLVDPYQIGKDNEEAIESGAFWFYYKLGFKPLQIPLKELAETEFAKMKESQQYRSSKAILRKLATSTLGIHLANDAMHEEPMLIAQFISNRIRTEYGGNREKAFEEAGKALRKVLNIYSRKALPQQLKETALWWVPQLQKQKLRETQKQKITALLFEKAVGNEFEYTRALQNFPFLIQAIETQGNPEKI